MMTPWGYETAAAPGPIISVADFNTRTGNQYASNPRVSAALEAASQAIRNYCGWHICPSMACTAYPIGDGKVLKLPATYVSAVSKVTEKGVELTDGQYEWRRDGLLRRACFKNWAHDWSGIKVEYTAGYDVTVVPDLSEAVCAIAAGVLSVSAGVISESADGVSISYSQSASSIAAGLTAQQQYALSAYKVVNAYGA